MNHKIKSLSLALCLFVLSACSERIIANEAGKRGQLRDAIYSIEPRANGATAIWLRYDDEGVYCTMDQAVIDKAKKILTEGTGWALIEYYTLYGTPNSNWNSCYNIESGGSKSEA
jgi:hypothetical protein